MKKLGMFAVFVLMAVLVPLTLYADTHTWTGGAAGTVYDDKWSTAENWSNGAPVAGDSAVFTGPAVYYGNNAIDIASVDTISYYSDGWCTGDVSYPFTARPLTGGLYNYAGTQNQVWQDFDISSTVTLHAAAGTVLEVNSVITGTGGVNKTGDGMVYYGYIYSPYNSYTGTTTISAGTLGTAWAGDIPSSSIVNNGVLRIDQGSYSGNISGTGTLLQASGNYVSLWGTNTYTGGTVVNAGTLHGYRETGLKGPYTANGAGTVMLNSDTPMWTMPSDLFRGDGTIYFNGYAPYYFSSAQPNFTGTIVMEDTDVRVSAANALQPDVLINHLSSNRNLTIAADQTLKGVIGSGPTVLSNGATLSIGHGGYGYTYNGNISGTGNLRKIDSGIIMLGGMISITGSITVEGGRLAVTNTGVLSTPMTLAYDGVLSGSGIVGDVTVDEGGVLSPGESPGMLSTGNEIWLGGGSYLWEIDRLAADGGSAGDDPGWDLLDVTGDLTISSTESDPFIIDLWTLSHPDHANALLANFDGAEEYSWLIAQASGSISFSDPNWYSIATGNFLNDTTGGSFTVSVTGGNQMYLNYVGAGGGGGQEGEVPEPSTLLLLLPLIGFGIWRMKRK